MNPSFRNFFLKKLTPERVGELSTHGSGANMV
jgi:hypothetical protein